MAKRKSGQQNSGGVTPPQEGRIVRSNSSPAVVTAGQAPKSAMSGFPAMNHHLAGSPPSDAKTGPKSMSNGPEKNFRSGGDPAQGSIVKGSPMVTAPAGAAPAVHPTVNIGPGHTDKSKAKVASDISQNQMDNNVKFAKGGKIKAPMVKDGDGDGYAKGGQINRHGTDKHLAGPADGGKIINGGQDLNAAGTGAPANAGNGGIKGGNAPIPLAQPGGQPSTGIIKSGRMFPSGAGADTPQPGGPTVDSGAQLRGPAVKRAGRAPSLPRMRRAA